MGKTELTEKFDRRENLRGTALTIMGGIFWGLADRAVCGSRDYHWNRAVFWMLHGRCPADRRNKNKSFCIDRTADRNGYFNPVHGSCIFMDGSVWLCGDYRSSYNPVITEKEGIKKGFLYERESGKRVNFSTYCCCIVWICRAFCKAGRSAGGDHCTWKSVFFIHFPLAFSAF